MSAGANSRPDAKRRKIDSGTKRGGGGGGGGAAAAPQALPMVRIGGVPEHFNYPLHMVHELKLDRKHGVQLEFVECNCGTGQMISNLKDNKVDLIVALTEGLVCDIAKGSDLRILGTYVSTPLCWAISGKGRLASGSASRLDESVDVPADISDLKGKTFGISRYGSGSHLMAYVLATQRGWNPQKDINFRVEGKFKQLRDSVNAGNTSAFMWESFTTKPFHDNGECTRLGDISTPWPCFMVAGLNTVITSKLHSIRSALAAVREAAGIFHNEAASTMPMTISRRYNLQHSDAKAWYSSVKISAHRFVSEAALESALEALVTAGVLPNETSILPSALVDDRIGQIQPSDIRKVRLYRSSSSLVRHLHTSLSKAGMDKGPLTVDALAPFDQRHHYGGIAAVEECINLCKITNESRVINIGSGLGGPSRYMASKAGCEVLAVELQHDLHSTAQSLTDKCDLAQRVTHMAGDFMEVERFLQRQSYSAIVSWLTVLHFSDRQALFRSSYDLLQPGGIFYMADLCRIGNLSVSERKILREEVYCLSLSNLAELSSLLEGVGFRVSYQNIRSDQWLEVTRERVKKWEAQKDDITAASGAELYEELRDFYAMIRDLMEAGHVGGVVIVAQKPLGW